MFLQLNESACCWAPAQCERALFVEVLGPERCGGTPQPQRSCPLHCCGDHACMCYDSGGGQSNNALQIAAAAGLCSLSCMLCIVSCASAICVFERTVRACVQQLIPAACNFMGSDSEVGGAGLMTESPDFGVTRSGWWDIRWHRWRMFQLLCDLYFLL